MRSNALRSLFGGRLLHFAIKSASACCRERHSLRVRCAAIRKNVVVWFSAGRCNSLMASLPFSFRLFARSSPPVKLPQPVDYEERGDKLLMSCKNVTGSQHLG